MILTTGDFCFLFRRFKGVNSRSCDRRIDRCFLTFHRNKVCKPLHTLSEAWVTIAGRGGNLLLAVPLMSYYRQTKHRASITDQCVYLRQHARQNISTWTIEINTRFIPTFLHHINFLHWNSRTSANFKRKSNKMDI